MSRIIHLYRVWDTVTNQIFEFWSTEVPTVSPINNPIDPTKTVIVDTISNQLPITDLDNYKVAVHSSPKPHITNTTYVVWIGAGDNMTTGEIGGGDMIQFSLTPGVVEQSVRVQFHPNHGRVWIHQGYIKFDGGGIGDHLHASVVALATPLQTVTNLNLEVVDNWIIPSANGTHGFADPNKIVLIPRTFSNDGHWDYDGVSLTPNLTGTGAYRICNVDRIIHKYVNRVPTRGICDVWSPLSSHDTSELPQNYVLELTAHNVSNTTWIADVFLEVYRERTCEP